MAGYSRKKEEKHAYLRFYEDRKNGVQDRLLLLFGKERYLVDWAIQSILKDLEDPTIRDWNVTRFSGDEMEWIALQNQCETLPMMADRRIVIVEDFPVLAGKKSRRFSEKEEEALLEYLSAVPETTTLIFTSESVDKRKKLYKSMEKNGACYEFKELDETLLTSFIEKRLRAAGKQAASGAISTLIRESGYFDKDTDYTLYNLENDLKKAFAHSDGDTVTREDVMNTVSGNLETDVFALLDAMSRGDRSEAFRLLHNSLFSGDNEYRLLALICSQLELMLSIKELQMERMVPAAISKRLGVHEFRVKKASSFVSVYSAAQLRRSLLQAYDIDKNIKSGVMEGRLGLELLIAGM